MKDRVHNTANGEMKRANLSWPDQIDIQSSWNGKKKAFSTVDVVVPKWCISVIYKGMPFSFLCYKNQYSSNLKYENAFSFPKSRICLRFWEYVNHNISNCHAWRYVQLISQREDSDLLTSKGRSNSMGIWTMKQRRKYFHFTSELKVSYRVHYSKRNYLERKRKCHSPNSLIIFFSCTLRLTFKQDWFFI